MKYTFTNYEAHLGLRGRRTCVIPDEVAADQDAFDGKTFPAVLLPDGIDVIRIPRDRIRVKLVGTDYGLHTSGTGDVIVRRA